MKEYQIELLEFLLKNNVLQFGEFTLKSGRKSPYYYNARNLSTGEALAKIGEVYAQKIVAELNDVDVLFGPAYAGIPLVVATAVHLAKLGVNKRFAYDRKDAKAYGDQKTAGIIMGDVKAGDRVLLVDDMITTGATKLEVKEKLEQCVPGLKFAGILVVFDRKEKDEQGVYAGDALRQKGLQLYSILDAPLVFEYLRKNSSEIVNENIYASFQSYYKQYGAST